MQVPDESSARGRTAAHLMYTWQPSEESMDSEGTESLTSSLSRSQCVTSTMEMASSNVTEVFLHPSIAIELHLPLRARTGL